VARKSDSAATPPIDHEAIRELAKLLDETGLTEIALERDGVSIRVARHSGAAIGRARSTEPALAAPGAITTMPAAIDPAQHPGVAWSPRQWSERPISHPNPALAPLSKSALR
jgi:acetyl-CoA carboxylase biotin carboxyl carrier protein